MLPYVCFGLIHSAILFLRNGSADSDVFLALLLVNTDGRLPIANALWFLTAMFFAEIIFWLIQSLAISQWYKAGISGVIAFCGMACATYLPYRLPLAFDVSMVAVGFYQFGKLINEKWPKLIDLETRLSVIGIIAFSAMGLANGYVNLRMGSYAIWPLFWINALGLTTSLLIFSKNIYKRWQEKSFFQTICKWINGIGRDSILYLCLNQLAILFARDLTGLFFNKTQGIMLLLERVMIFIIAMVELYLAQKIIMGTSLKVIVGK